MKEIQRGGKVVARLYKANDVIGKDGKTLSEMLAEDRSEYGKRKARNRSNKANVCGPYGEPKF